MTVRWDFSGQTAIVTGAARGIGRGVAEAFLQAGARVVGTYAGNDAAAEALRAANADHGDRLELRRFDVADYGAVEGFYREIEEKFPDGFEILVNNAGIRRDAVIGMMASEDWRRVIDVNLTGVYNMTKFAVMQMMGRRYGRIINVTSPSGRMGFAGQANYAASKAGMVALTQSVAKEVGRRKITVNCVSPGFIDTDFIQDLPEEMAKEYKKMSPLQRFGSVDEVAHGVLFLASREAAYVTGTTLEISGGL